MTAPPVASISRGGKPNPSQCDGKAKARAPALLDDDGLQRLRGSLIGTNRLRMRHRLATTSTFGVNVLAADQRDLALLFAARLGGPAPEIRWAGDPGAPRLPGAVAYFTCRPWAGYDGGDHVLHLGEVVDFEAPGGPPLVFHSGALGELGRAPGGTVWAGSLDGPAHGWGADFGALAATGGKP